MNVLIVVPNNERRQNVNVKIVTPGEPLLGRFDVVVADKDTEPAPNDPNYERIEQWFEAELAARLDAPETVFVVT
jgi:hypothetical protein